MDLRKVRCRVKDLLYQIKSDGDVRLNPTLPKKNKLELVFRFVTTTNKRIRPAQGSETRLSKYFVQLPK